MDGFYGGGGGGGGVRGVQTPPGSGKHPQKMLKPPQKNWKPPRNFTDFHYSHYSLDYFTTMKVF